ncbi:hypothetical protein GX51_02811 [Blastomyces parvus]|uniref:BTB domain-containing protein n=1 Tax=Blastomyces parvus TaxID=2060905 RepID=A0A2B7XA59_9EURO|nr:hypothetical protein GX51_02811 [Blastomyces parvus]
MASQAASFNESSKNNMDAASTSKGPDGSENTIIEIAENGDLVVVVIEYHSITTWDITIGKNVESWQAAKSASFQVKRSTLANHSTYFNKMLFGGCGETNQKTIVLEEDNIAGMGLWLRIMHANIPSTYLENVSIGQMRHAILACDKYELERDKMAPWFRKWWETLSGKTLSNTDLYNMVLLCCYFRCEEGFMVWTRKLVYESSDIIAESDPIGTRPAYMCLPGGLIKSLNNIKGQIRIILYHCLCSPINSLVTSDMCNRLERVVFHYIIELRRLGASPLIPDFRRKGIRDILQRLEKFEEKPEEACVVHPTDAICNFSFRRTVEQACSAADNYFQGRNLGPNDPQIEISWV